MGIEKNHILAYAAKRPKEKLEKYQYPFPSFLGDHEVIVQISHCGVCHSDACMIDNEWKSSHYPLVPGHEIIGTVIRTGPAVGYLSGRRVGIGWQAGACYHCESCHTHEENLCRHLIPMIQGNNEGHERQGGFATHTIADGRLCYLIPENLKSEMAAPLLCAGITVFSPLRKFDVEPGKRIGVVGLGGLGHLAVQFARAMGAEVVVFSSSAEKNEDAKRFGAKEVYATQEPNLGNRKLELDLILVTATANYDWSSYIANLKTRGVLCFVSLPTDAIRVQASQLIMKERSITGSVIGGSERMREMLNFASEKNIQPQIELYPISQVNEVLERLKNNEVRYRAVFEGFTSEEFKK